MFTEGERASVSQSTVQRSGYISPSFFSLSVPVSNKSLLLGMISLVSGSCGQPVTRAEGV